jgi:hypothetical protein
MGLCIFAGSGLGSIAGMTGRTACSWKFFGGKSRSDSRFRLSAPTRIDIPTTINMTITHKKAKIIKSEISIQAPSSAFQMSA